MAQEGNTKALKNGSRTARAGMVLAQLGERFETVNSHLFQMRRALERKVFGSQATPPLLDVARVNEALRWEMVAQVVQRLIADDPKMPAEQVVSNLNTIGNATRQRNAMLAKLLNGKSEDPGTGDPWALLDSPQAPESTPTALDAGQAVPAAELAAGDATGSVAERLEGYGGV